MVCLFVCAVDLGENEGEPVDEQYCEPVNEDQFRDSEPELDPMWVAVWCYVVAWLLFIIICMSVLLGGLYGNEPSDVINVASASWD